MVCYSEIGQRVESDFYLRYFKIMDIYFHFRKTTLATLFKLFHNEKNLDYFVNKKESVSFIQIGANDGVQADNINIHLSSKWQGWLVEPLPYYFENLKKNYNNSSAHLEFVNCAVSNKAGQMEIFYLNPNVISNFPVWCHGLGTSSKIRLIEQVEGLFNSDTLLQDSIMSTVVPTVTFEQFVNKYKIRNIDLLAIDTEGHDFIILDSINMKKYQIGAFLFEFKHMKLREIFALVFRFFCNGYNVRFHSQDDIIAIKKNASSIFES
jgi:FkbM family methyltransferase